MLPLLRHLESLKSGIDVKFNLGSELDFGPGFYITPDFEQARKFINKQVEVLNRSSSNNNIFDSEEEVGIIVEFRISNFIEIFKNPDYHCHYFAKHKKSESDLDFAEFVVQNRENPDELQHHFDFIYGVQTDDNPTQALARFRQNEITKEEMLAEFRKPYSFKQLSIHNQSFCDIMKIEKVYQSKTGEELQKLDSSIIGNNIKLYSSELFQALLKASNYKLDKRIAQTVAEGYARNLDYSDPELMHVGVTSVANNLLTKIKQEYFNV